MVTPDDRRRAIGRSPYDPDLHGPLLILIDAERARQIYDEGWSAEHDDRHDSGELLHAAAIYLHHAKGEGLVLRPDGAPIGWPWEASAWNPKDKKRDLVRAGALCLAEQARLRRKHGRTGHVVHVEQKLRLIVQALRSALTPAVDG